MLKELERLSDSEMDLLSKVPMLVCILIAGADNEIDNKEIKKAIELAKKGKSKASVAEFYRIASEDFEDKLKITLQGLPLNAAKRNELVASELAELNNIFPKIEPVFASDLYQSLLYIARKIAESSGGLLGMRTVGNEEQKLISLPMIIAPSGR